MKHLRHLIITFSAAALSISLAACSVSRQAAVQSTAAAKDARVLLGIDNLEKDFSILNGKNVGLITNATGVDSSFSSTIDILYTNTKLTALFAPEHGIRGAAGAGDSVGADKDQKTGLPVYSLYGDTRKPTKEMLSGIDVLVYDIQDVGSRYYTYISTMQYAMQAAAENNIPFIVLDRPNPLNGVDVQGEVLEDGFESFVGITHIPQRYGLTCGELAEFMNTEDKIGCDLTVIKMSNWKRSMYYEDTGLTCWVLPSPNMPTVDTAVVYPGNCIFEGTNLSEGRGTTKPFEIIGAPWIDSQALADKMNSLGMAGVHFRATTFTPSASKFKDESCNGVEVHVTDRSQFNSVLSGIALLYTIRDMYPNDFQYLDNGQFERLTGTDAIRKGTYTLDQLKTQFEDSSKSFQELSSKYYLYKD
jgi:uncharacterized protein YbbC (DUF1343 family)